MSARTVTLTSDQRDALREGTVLMAAGVIDLEALIEAGEHLRPFAYKLVRRAAAALALLDQLGWDRESTRGTYDVTVDDETAWLVGFFAEQGSLNLTDLAEDLADTGDEEGRRRVVWLADRELDFRAACRVVLGDEDGEQ